MIGGGEVKNVFTHPKEVLIWAHPENLVKIRLIVQEVVKAGGRGKICLPTALLIIDSGSP